MTGAIFYETLHRSWRTAIYWGIGIGLLGLIQVVIVPDSDALQQMADLMESMPSGLMEMFGGGDAQFNASPEGYLTLQFFSLMLLILAIYSVLAGLNTTANEEDQGIMDMILSLPLPRWRLIVEKFAAYTLLTILLLAVMLVGLWLGVEMTPALSVSIDFEFLLRNSFNILPGMLFIMGMTVLLGTIIRRKTMATAVAAVIVIGSYFLDAIGMAASETIVNDLRVFSFYRYYDFSAVAQHGLDWGNIIILLVATAFTVAGALYFFKRRDVGI